MVDELTISLKLLFVNKNSKSAHSTGYSSVVSNKMDFGEAKASNHKMDVFQFFVHLMPVKAHNSSVLNTSHVANLMFKMSMPILITL